ncbi:MAG: hypothetical protein SF187_19155 [Deltaproteobacteria bacterium]|nr:hypothetical protein [Deltaproteobacteria bacterium]
MNFRSGIRIASQRIEALPLWACTLWIALLIALRNPLPLVRAELWAEDGVYFFQGWWEQGIRSVWTPVTGYHLLLSRLVAWLSGTMFPIVAIPYAYAVAALAINAFCMAYLVRPGFAWIFPSRVGRLFVACLIASGPGTSEVFLNLANLQAGLTWLGVLLLLEQPWNLSRPKIFVLVAVFLSTGSAFVLGPILVYLLFVTRRRSYFYLLLLLAAVLAVNALSHSKSMASFTGYENVPKVPEIVLSNFALRFFLVPFFGEQGALPVFKSGFLAFWSVCAGPAIVAGIVFQKSSWPVKEKLTFTVVAIAASLMLGAIALTRAYSVPLLVRGTGHVLWDVRYSFLPGAVALLYWTAALLRFRSLGSYAAVALICFNILTHWRNVPIRPDLDWPEMAQNIESLLREKSAGNLTETRALEIKLQPPAFGPMKLTVTP